MHPILHELSSGVQVRSYGVLCLVGVVVGLAVALRLGGRQGLDRRRLTDALLWALVGGLVGSKLLLMAVDARALIAEPWVVVDLLGSPRRLPRALVLWQGGLIFYGGLAGGALAAGLYCRRKKLSLGGVADAIVPAVAIGHVWGRIACFLAGCCYGKAGGGGLGVHFGLGSAAHEAHAEAGLLDGPMAETTYSLHPAQLYGAATEVAIAGLLLWLWPRRRYRGQVALVYLSAYSVARFFVEMFRGDRGRGFVGEPTALVSWNRLLGMDGGSPTLLSVSQLAAVVTLLVCGWVWLLYRHQRARRGGDGGGS